MESQTTDYSSLFYLSPLPQWVYDVSTFEILDVNEAAIQHYGYSRDEFLKMTIKDLRPKEEIPKLVAAHIDIDSQQGNIYFGVFTHQKKNREKIRMKINGHRVDFRCKKCVLVVCQDVTEEEKQAQLIKESEERLKATSSIAKLGYWRLKLDTNSLTWSDEIYTIWGRDRFSFDVAFKSFFETIHPDDKKTFELEQNVALTGEKELDFVHRILLPDNSIKWVHELGRLIKDQNGFPIFFEGTVQDVTQQKEEEQRLKLLESVITNTSDAILITEAEPFDEPGPRIVYVNEAFTKMTGYTAEEVIGKTPRILQGPKSDKAELARLSKALRNWESCEITTINYKKNGEEFWINFTVSPVANEKGWFTHWIAVERDVTDKKNRELEQNLLSQISLIFNEEKKLVDATQRVCDTFADFAGFDFVEVWTPNLENSHIQLLNFSHHSEQAAKFYEDAGAIRQFEIGDGLPGLVYKTKKPMLLNPREHSETFIRKLAAVNSGISAVLGLPLLFNDTVVGVLLFGDTKEPKFMKRFVKLFHRLENFIGSEIHRKSLETNLQNLFEAIPDIVCLADFRGRFLRMNKAGCKLLGYSEEELLYHSFDEFVHPEDKDISANEVMKLSEGETTFKFENRYITKSGEIVWLSWTCNSEAEAGVIYASAKNITKEKKLSELNRLSSKLAKIGSWEIDVMGNRLFWSDIVYELHETDPATFSPDLETAINLYRADFREFVQTQVNACITNGVPFDFEAVLITLKNNERWVRAIGNAEFRNGICTRIYGSFQDIHERKESELRLKSISDDLPGVAFQYIILPDGSDSMQGVSKAAHTIWNLSPQECEQNNELIWNQIKRGGDFEQVQKSIQESISKNKKWNFRWRNVLPSEEVRWHEGYGTPNFLADGTIVFNSLIFDITEEKRATLLYEETAGVARMGSWEVNLITGDVYFSKVTREIHELEENQTITFEEAIKFYSPDYREFVSKIISESIEQGTLWDFEVPIITAKGRERWVRGIGQVETIEGKAVRIFGSFQDIHQRKLAEKRLQAITDDLPGVAFQYHLYPDGTDRLLSVSRGSRQIWGVAPEVCEENVNVVWDQIKRGGDYDSVVSDIMHSIQTKTQWHSKWRNIWPNGEIRWHEGFGTPYIQPDGTVVFNSMVFDTTEEFKARELYDEASRLARIGSWELNLISQNNSDNMYWSPMLKEILEVGQDYNPSLTGGFEFYVGESKIAIQQGVDNLLATGEIFDLELQVQTARGNIRWIRCIGKAEFANGKCERIFGSYQDIHDRKITEIQLKALTDNLPGAVFQYVLHPDGTDQIAYISEGSYRIWGLSPADCMAYPEKIWQQIEAGGNIEAVASSIKESAENLTLWEAQWRNVTPDGNVRYYEGKGVPQRLANGAVIWNSLILDITDRTLFEQNYLVAQEDRIAVLESISDAFYAVDENWNFTYFNKEAEDLLRRKSQEVLGNNIWTEFHPAKGTEIEEKYRKVAQTGISESFEYFYPGDNCWYEINAYPSKGGVSAFFKNIDGKRKAAEDLQRAYEEKNTVLESIGDAFFTVDKNWVVGYWNKQCENLLVRKREEILGKNLWEEFPDAVATDFYDQYHRAMETGMTSQVEDYYATVDKWFDASAFPTADGLTVYFRDVSERKRHESELLELNETLKKHAHELELTNDQLEQFAFIASHDLQEPLRMITSFLDQLKRKYGGQLDEKAHQYIHFATDGAKRMKQIILDLLEYSRAGNQQENRVKINFDQLIGDYKSLRKKIIHEKSVVIDHSPLPVIDGYRAPFTQVIHCLLDNAIKYSREGIAPRIELGVEETESEWVFSVRDNGIGISPEFNDKIFVIFQRLHNHEYYGGNGIGLSIVKKQVESWGGKVWLESTVGEGTAFYFTVPKN